jgi:aryl-alcohol dehydrogenase-like predicted oxidoreductase
MKRLPLGSDGPLVSRIGLGCMGMSGMYGPSDRAESIATIHAAIDAGVDLFDTGDFYGMGHNELLLRDALRERKREELFIQVKFGAQRDVTGQWLGFDARPAAVKTALAYTLQRLGTDYVDLYQPARLDPNVPIEETVGAIADCVKAGWVRHIGLSEIGAATLRRAHAAHPIRALQIEYSLMSRGIEREILPTARELGIGLTVYGVLSRGLYSRSGGDAPRGADFRAHQPRWQGENFARNVALVERLRAIGEPYGATPVQLAIAWVLSRGNDIIPLLGSRTRQQLVETLAACDLAISAADLLAAEEAVPPEAVAGARYPDAQMAVLDSEKRAKGDA